MSEPNCKNNCLKCKDVQVYKVNLAKYHGVCEKHFDKTPTIEQCFMCSAKIPILCFRAASCDFCQKQIENKKNPCTCLVCENCFDYSKACPQCNQELIKFEVDSQFEALKQPVLFNVPGSLNGTFPNYANLKINKAKNPIISSSDTLNILKVSYQSMPSALSLPLIPSECISIQLENSAELYILQNSPEDLNSWKVRTVWSRIAKWLKFHLCCCFPCLRRGASS